MSCPGFTRGIQAANRAATNLNSKTNRGLLTPAEILSTLARFGLVLALLVVGAQAQTYNAADQFSSTTNTDTSRWSYRYNTTGTRDGNYMLLTYVEEAGNVDWSYWGKLIALPGWFSQPTAAFCPYITANQFSMPLEVNFGAGPIIVPARSIIGHPSTTSDVGDTVVSFLVPKAGTVTVTYSFTDIDPYGGNGVNWYVDLNSGAAGDLYSGTVDSTPGHVGTATKSFQIAVSQGDRLNFIIDSNGDYGFDSTAVRATITY
jgi:hypothetical protein